MPPRCSGRAGRFVQPGAPGEGELNAKELADVQHIRTDVVEWVDVGLCSKRHDVAVVELLVVLDSLRRKVKKPFNINRVWLAVRLT